MYVNLFIASELNWEEKGAVIRQETNFPEAESTSILIKTENPAEFTLRIRIPWWAERGAAIKIGGETQDGTAKPSSYANLKRTWKDGDRVEVTLPMDLHLAPMPDDGYLAAVMYGPLVLAGGTGTGELSAETVHVKSQRDHDDTPLIAAPRLIGDPNRLQSWIQPVPGEPLTFQTKGAGDPNDIKLVPLHKLFGKRYAVYWPFHTKEEWRGIDEEKAFLQKCEEAELKAVQNRTVDRVEPGAEDSEREHGLESDKSRSGPHQGKHWRDAIEDGLVQLPPEGAAGRTRVPSLHVLGR